jgi:diaminopimelate decarboxylase
MTFDNLVELEKIVAHYPEAEVVLRIASNDSMSRLPFGFKFGASFAYATELIHHAVRLTANLVGISFHVGSGALSSIGFIDTLHSAAKLFDIAKAAGNPLTLLDIGGGYPGDDTGGIIFEHLARDIKPVIDQLFPPEITVIAEPGRYFCNASITMALKIYAKREYWASKTTKDEDGTVIQLPPVKEVQYYVPDGQYGSFNSIMYDHSQPAVNTLRPPPADVVMENTTFFGPTCDSIDVIAKNIMFPPMQLDDWIWCPNMGAYTIAAGSRFNGFERPTLHYRMSLHK